MGARVLIIDDSPTEVHRVRELLASHGYEVLTAASADIGIAMVREQKPDLVLMDIMMPGINGFQATRQITRDPATNTVPVIMLTSKNQDADRVWGERQGARGYVTKPIDATVLLETIRQVLAGKGAA
jgi:twitching motility two-component system response regulator PilH